MVWQLFHILSLKILKRWIKRWYFYYFSATNSICMLFVLSCVCSFRICWFWFASAAKNSLDSAIWYSIQLTVDLAMDFNGWFTQQSVRASVARHCCLICNYIGFWRGETIIFISVITGCNTITFASRSPDISEGYHLKAIIYITGNIIWIFYSWS